MPNRRRLPIVIVGCFAPLCTEGRVLGGLQGDLTLTATSLTPSGPTGLPTVFFFTGQSVIEATVLSDYRGELCPP